MISYVYSAFFLLLFSWGIYSVTLCDLHDTTPSGRKCFLNESCMPVNKSELGVCQCKRGFIRLTANANCTREVETTTAKAEVTSAPSSARSSANDGGGGHVAAAVLIPTVLIVLVVIGVYVNRKYQLVTWVRNKVNQRESPYDEVMIGQDDDDPPLAS